MNPRVCRTLVELDAEILPLFNKLMGSGPTDPLVHEQYQALCDLKDRHRGYLADRMQDRARGHLVENWNTQDLRDLCDAVSYLLRRAR